MAVNIVVPELSESVVEATIADWLKKEGDDVTQGETVVILETDKVTLEVAAPASGTLGKIVREVGDDVGPGDVLGMVEAQGSAAVAQPAAQLEPVTAIISAAATAPAKAEDQKVTPVAKRMAEANNVDIAQVPAASGKVTKGDVQNFINQGTTPAAAPTPAPATPKPAASSPAVDNSNGRKEETIRMSRRRQTIAARLIEAQSTAAMLTTFNEIDMQAVMDIRKRRKDSFKEKFNIGLGFSSFFVKATIGALKAFPYVNAEIREKEIILKHYYDIGIAIGAEEGLVVPVLRDADRLSFAKIEQQIRDYATQSQNGTLSIDSLMGGTFTITNGGVYGSLMSTPILNPPQVGILGLHAIKERPVVVNGEIVIRPMMYVALTYDHRIVDGREAVQFLVKVKDLIEDPESLLIEG